MYLPSRPWRRLQRHRNRRLSTPVGAMLVVHLLVRDAMKPMPSTPWLNRGPDWKRSRWTSPFTHPLQPCRPSTGSVSAVFSPEEMSPDGSKEDGMAVRAFWKRTPSPSKTRLELRHNKGIMNAISSVALASGDWRAIGQAARRTTGRWPLHVDVNVDHRC